LLLESSFRPRFSKYPKPKRGIGLGSLKTGAKEGYRPRSSRTRSQKVAGSQGYRPQSKETRCQKRVNGFGSSNNRSHTLYLGFKIHKPFFRPAPSAPLSLRARASPTIFHKLSPAPEPRRRESSLVDASDRPNYGLVVLRLVVETSASATSNAMAHTPRPCLAAKERQAAASQVGMAAPAEMEGEKVAETSNGDVSERQATTSQVGMATPAEMEGEKVAEME